MDWDFSHLNLEYLVQARDLARSDRQRACAVLGVPETMVGILADLTPQLLAKLTRIDRPLVIPRQNAWWWSRLLVVLLDGQPAEIENVVAHTAVTRDAAEEERKR